MADDDARVAARHELWLLQQDRAAQLAGRAVRRAGSLAAAARAYVVVVIDVDDPSWTALVDALMPGHDWDAYRRKGAKPVARGYVHRVGFVEDLARQVPDVAPAVQVAPPPGQMHVAVLAAGGTSIYLVVPATEPS